MNECAAHVGGEGGTCCGLDFEVLWEGTKNTLQRSLSAVGQMRVPVQRQRKQVVKRDNLRGYHKGYLVIV